MSSLETLFFSSIRSTSRAMESMAASGFKAGVWARHRLSTRVLPMVNRCRHRSWGHRVRQRKYLLGESMYRSGRLPPEVVESPFPAETRIPLFRKNWMAFMTVWRLRLTLAEMSLAQQMPPSRTASRTWIRFPNFRSEGRAAFSFCRFIYIMVHLAFPRYLYSIIVLKKSNVS